MKALSSRILRTLSLLGWLSLAAPTPSALADRPLPLGNRHVAIVIVDMQDEFYLRQDTENTEQMINLRANQFRLLNWGMSKNFPILFFEYENFGKTDARLTDETGNHPHKIVIKSVDGGFETKTHSESGERALETLRAWNIDTLIVSGVNGDSCVRSTIIGAIDHGLRVMTSSDLVANANYNPPIYPDDTWFINNPGFRSFPNLEDLIIYNDRPESRRWRVH
jgi:nicotinamidase-related amidase